MLCTDGIFVGATVQWLRDNMNMIQKADESAAIAESASKSGEVYFVPAFSGLYAPYWRKDARRY